MSANNQESKFNLDFQGIGTVVGLATESFMKETGRLSNEKRAYSQDEIARFAGSIASEAVLSVFASMGIVEIDDPSFAGFGIELQQYFEDQKTKPPVYIRPAIERIDGKLQVWPSGPVKTRTENN